MLRPRARDWLQRARAGLETPVGRIAAAVAALAMGALVVLIALSGDEAPPPTGAPPEAAGQEQEASGRPDVPRAVAKLVEQLSVEDKVAQLMLVGFDGTDSGDPVFAALEETGYGGLVIGGRNYVSPEQVQALADEARSSAKAGKHLVPWVMAPQEGGEFNALEGLPPDAAPAELASPGEAKQAAQEAADALLDLGVTGVLAPVIDVGTSDGGALGERAYSDLPERVKAYALATLAAYEQAGVFTAPKHFPGLGSASQSTELGPANVGLSIEQLHQRDLIPFKAAIRAGAPGIVVGHGLYGVDDFLTPASTSKTIVTDLLRRELGFDGVAIADDLTAPGLTAAFQPRRAAVDAVRAGIDMVYVSAGGEPQKAIRNALVAAVRDGKISRGRLDEAVGRVLLAKRATDVLDADDIAATGQDAGGGGGRQAPAPAPGVAEKTTTGGGAGKREGGAGKREGATGKRRGGGERDRDRAQKQALSALERATGESFDGGE